MVSMSYKVAPLSAAFTAVSLMGFMVSVVYTAFGTLDVTWGFTIGLFFIIMFIASMISMTYAPVDALVETSRLGRSSAKKRRKTKRRF